MEYFDLGKFGKALQEYIANAIPFPTNNEQLDANKHKNRNPRHLQQQVRNEFMNNYEMISLNQQAFNLGSEKLEVIYPHYHILEDSEVIHKKGEGTTTSRGSMANVNRKERDYGVLVSRTNKNTGKTSLYQEYRKNVRGKRSGIKYATYKVVDDNGVVSEYKKAVGTKSSTTYINEHYHYIEKNLDTIIIPEIKALFGLKQKRTQITSLFDDNEDFMLKVFNV